MGDRRAPPIGVKPEWLWREHRAAELALAVHRQLTTEGHTPDARLIRAWVDELHCLAPFLDRSKYRSDR